jgi:hypothetical protein
MSASGDGKTVWSNVWISTPAHVVLLPPILLFGTLIPVLYVPVEIKNDDRFGCRVKHSKTLLFVNDVTLFRHGLVKHEHACN